MLAGGGALLHGLAGPPPPRDRHADRDRARPAPRRRHRLGPVAGGVRGPEGRAVLLHEPLTPRPSWPSRAAPVAAPASRIALLVLTSITLLTLDFRDAGGRAERPPHAPARCSRRSEGAAETVSSSRSPTPGTASPTTATSRPRTSELREQLDELEGEAVLEEDAAEPARRDRSSSRTSSGSATSTPPSARVLSSDPSNFSHTIDINKGSDDGIKVGMPVVNGAGLVGRIVQVTPNRSTVQLITDPDFARRRPAARQRPGHRHRARAGPRRGPPRRHPPRARRSTIRPSPAPRSPPAARSAAPSPTRIPVGKVRDRARGRRRAHARARGATRWPTPSGMQFVTVLLWEPPE